MGLNASDQIDLFGFPDKSGFTLLSNRLVRHRQLRIYYETNSCQTVFLFVCFNRNCGADTTGALPEFKHRNRQ